MKKLFENWRKYLTEGSSRSLDEFVNLYAPGKIRLFHFSRRSGSRDMDRIIIDPQYFVTSRGAYSRREWETSRYPRSFYYTDPEDIEFTLMGGKKLFSVDVSAESIYELAKDRAMEGYIKKHAHKTYGLRKDMEWTTMLKDISDSYDGIYYTLGPGGPPVIAYFKILEAKAVM